VNEIRDVDRVLSSLEYGFDQVRYYMTERERLGLRGLGPAQTDERQQQLTELERRYREDCRADLEGLLTFPPRHIRHQPELDRFWADGGYEDSVFIMTKFPADPPVTAKDHELVRILEVIDAAVGAAGFIPRIARKRYHPLLWDNVELHMLGCRRGIALVEDRYVQELNPNVAMEWGWMRGMRKDVLYLVEESFEHDRADLSGLLEERFSWDDPEDDVRRAVAEFLTPS
jgi:hypothetical protein